MCVRVCFLSSYDQEYLTGLALWGYLAGPQGKHQTHTHTPRKGQKISFCSMVKLV